MVICTDVHPSDMWMLDDQGNLWDYGAPASSPGHFSTALPLRA
jgi:hypothetical protein